jgi:predicted Rossmann fold nucleotide-binding protein DprA/Smf involved in DNA uptake
MNPTAINSTDPEYPRCLQARLAQDAPKSFNVLGDVALLLQRKTALFCSVRCPGDKILAAYDAARQLRDAGVTVISGFHSPVEKECLRILLRGNQPIVICLARAMDEIRLPAAWRGPLNADRLLLVSPFRKRPRRPTVESSQYRNKLVAALCDEVLIVHTEPGGNVAHISEMLDGWKIPKRKLF